MSTSLVAALFTEARNGQPQKSFALTIGVSQSSLSRYENGKANPPVIVIERCMRLVHRKNEVSPTANVLADRIKEQLQSPDYDDIRFALSKLIDSVSKSQQQQTGN
jgi:transcriptional regulator with XRE-family HTH domain